MSQRCTDLSSPAFGRQVLDALAELLCQHLPLGVWGLKINDPLVWTILADAASRRTTIEQAALGSQGCTLGQHYPGAPPPDPAGRRRSSCGSWSRGSTGPCRRNCPAASPND